MKHTFLKQTFKKEASRLNQQHIFQIGDKMWKVSSWQYLIEHRGDEPHLSFTWEERWVKRELRFEKISRYLQMPLGLIFCTQWMKFCIILVVIYASKMSKYFSAS